MLVFRDIELVRNFPRPVVAAVGNFDGIHLGHNHLISALLEKKSAMSADVDSPGTALLITFYPHPAQVLRKATEVPRITTFRQNFQILKQMGVDVFCLIHFTTQFSQIDAKDFIESYLVGNFGVDHLILGSDASIGRDRKGTPSQIQKHFLELDRTSDVLEPLTQDGIKVSSRTIREFITIGDLLGAKKLLGRNYSIQGRVSHGAAKGRTIGFPTANLAVRDQVIPPSGVYVTRSTIRGSIWGSVTNVGYRPTFGGTSLEIETYIIDYSGEDFYQEMLSVEFLERIRDEMRFDSVEQLRQQILNDVDAARNILKEYP